MNLDVDILLDGYPNEVLKTLRALKLNDSIEYVVEFMRIKYGYVFT